MVVVGITSLSRMNSPSSSSLFSIGLELWRAVGRIDKALNFDRRVREFADVLDVSPSGFVLLEHHLCYPRVAGYK